MQNYSKIDQLLHRIVLGSPVIGETLFDLENRFNTDKNVEKDLERPVFVTGLARAGTTVLMRALYESGQFASLTYDDMPFVMAPNFWHKISYTNKKKRVKGERAHGDGIEVDFDSPEALEEVFWRTFHGKEYIQRKSLVPHEYSSETAEIFHAYQARVCQKYGKKRYLSKNNNHILRIKSLAKDSNNPCILIPFRNPIEQSYSLYRQHQKFAASTSFVKKYMEWLAHYEFGASHRPFQFAADPQANTRSKDQTKHPASPKAEQPARSYIRQNQKTAPRTTFVQEKSEASAYGQFQAHPKSLDFAERPIKPSKPDSIDYWLQRWIEAYQYILQFLEEQPANAMSVCYERLCEDPKNWESICEFIEIPKAKTTQFVRSKMKGDLADTSANLVSEALAIYDRLTQY